MDDPAPLIAELASFRQVARVAGGGSVLVPYPDAGPELATVQTPIYHA